ncbi:hypothetical protein BJV78DRAFT_276476 [Lactifluus subvellereus]|nr:hypothetical protein BJV78DRAFT_276476 [Lactifluus subvellereus]
MTRAEHVLVSCLFPSNIFLYFLQYFCMSSESGQAVVTRTTATGADVHNKGQPCQRRSSQGNQSLDLTSQNLRAWTTNTARFLEEVRAEVKQYADPNCEIGRVCAADGTWVDVDTEEASGGTRTICPWAWYQIGRPPWRLWTGFFLREKRICVPSGVRLLVTMNDAAESLSISNNTHRPSATA